MYTEKVVGSATTSPWIPLDDKQPSFNATIGVTVTDTLTYTVEFTLSNIQDPTVTPFVFTTELVDETASASFNLRYPVTAIRLNVTSYTSGTATIGVNQGTSSSSERGAYSAEDHAVSHATLGGFLGFLTPPADFLFDFSKLGSQLKVYKNGDQTIGWEYDYPSLIPATAKAAPLARIIHVATTGNDANTGVGAYLGDFSNAKKGVDAAITYGNSLGAGYQIVVQSGTYVRNDSWNATLPTQPLWLRGWYDDGPSNRPLLSMHDALTWTLDGTYTNCYTATRTSALRVLDVIATLDDNGDVTELTKVASAATCNSTQNSWYTDGTVVYVNRADDAVVSNANTWVEISVLGIRLGATSAATYVEGIQFWGGNHEVKGRPADTVCFVDCDFKWQGGSASVVNAMPLQDYNLGVFVRCTAAHAYVDGFNGHAVGANVPTMLTLDCVGYANGDPTQTSCNGWTIHDGMMGIDVNGTYYSNRGANVVPVTDTTQCWLVGTRSFKSLGDSGFAPSNFYFLNSLDAWMDSCVGRLSHYDIVAGTSARVFVRDHTTYGCFLEESTSGGAVITPY